MNYIGFTPLPTGSSVAVKEALGHLNGSATTHTSMKAVTPTNPTIISIGQGYVVSRFRLNEWTPSDAEIEAAMLAYEDYPESSEQFKKRLFLSLINDADGIYP